MQLQGGSQKVCCIGLTLRPPHVLGVALALLNDPRKAHKRYATVASKHYVSHVCYCLLYKF